MNHVVVAPDKTKNQQQVVESDYYHEKTLNVFY